MATAIARMQSSKTWRLADAIRSGIAPLRRGLGGACRLLRRLADRLGAIAVGSASAGVPVGNAAAIEETTAAVDERPDTLLAPAPEQSTPGPGSATDRNALLRLIPRRSTPYEEYLRNNSRDHAAAREAEQLLAEMERRPLISVIVTARPGPSDGLRETLESLRAQVYPRVQVIVADASSTASAMLDGQLSSLPIGPGGFAEACAEAAARANGSHLVFLDGRTRLAPDALLHLALAATESAVEPDLIYGDDDEIDGDGRRFGPRFRAGWSPELLLSCPYIGSTFAICRSTYEAIGGLRSRFEEAWPYDLILRLSERPCRVAHVARVLAHVRADRGGPRREPIGAVALAASALAESIERRGIVAGVGLPDWAARRGVPCFELDFPDRGPRVAILIPTKDRVDLLRRCIGSVLERTTYRDFEIVVIDDGSDDAETLAYLDGLEAPCRVVRSDRGDGRFNYARMHNRAIRALPDGVEFVLLLNNDTEVRRPEWLSQLVGYARMPGVGAVGARLFYGDGRIQHAGMVTDLHDGLPGHLFKFAPWWEGGPDARVARNVDALTAACLLVARSKFLEFGGFDEGRFAVGYNDVDFCRRLGRHGLRCVYAPRAELLHLEGASRGVIDDPSEAAAYLRRWGGRCDPYHHPSFARGDERSGLSTRRALCRTGQADRAPRILLCVDGLDATGDAAFVGDLALGLRDRGLIIPAVRSPSPGPVGRSLLDGGIALLIEPEGAERSPFERAKLLAGRLASEGSDLVHAVGLDGFAAVHAARLAGIPAIWTIRRTSDFRDAFAGFDEPSAHAAIGAFSDAYRVTFPAWGTRRPYHPVESRWNFEVIREAIPAPVASLDPAEAQSEARSPRAGLSLDLLSRDRRRRLA